ncbi:DUF2470 domain-containing protein [Streptomyces sp. DSM 44915]|uniref:DUF2470 domain-containing protein n=1 Tax=Streptomyces chisholmiae TaxID=3075540 RepID=A0ABU2JWM8_9ACTN|nr:DUF2470 domain-containing protein [Streptomyces sp. DSM 44915]MDT0268909.1 DUF2470 domain-containing protein [Streptomyces sp. DSM 44915]
MIRPGSPLPDTENRSREAGQPRPTEEAQQPTAAERVRTLVESNASATLTIPGTERDTFDNPVPSVPEARAVTPRGDVLLLVPADSLAGRTAAHALHDEVTAVMEITDVAPVSVPQRIRGRAWVAGWLTAVPAEESGASRRLLARAHPAGPTPGPGWTLLRLEVGEAYTDDLWGEAHVEPDEFATAEADPLARHEAELLQHLAASHQEQLRSLCRLMAGELGDCEQPERIAPLGLDRFGLRLRCRTAASCFDARFDFPEPVHDVAQLRRAMRWLFESAAEHD